MCYKIRYSFIKYFGSGVEKPRFFVKGKRRMKQKPTPEQVVTPVIESKGYDVVRVMLIGKQNPTLQIMIERKDHKNLTVDDCASVSRAVSEVLDDVDPIDGEYSLEVSSPGLDRPLTKLEHFDRFAGKDARVETGAEVEGRKRFKGKILSVDAQNNVQIEMNGEVYAIPFEKISKAKLILTDELLNEYIDAQEDDEL